MHLHTLAQRPLLQVVTPNDLHVLVAEVAVKDRLHSFLMGEALYRDLVVRIPFALRGIQHPLLSKKESTLMLQSISKLYCDFGFCFWMPNVFPRVYASLVRNLFCASWKCSFLWSSRFSLERKCMPHYLHSFMPFFRFARMALYRYFSARSE